MGRRGCCGCCGCCGGRPAAPPQPARQYVGSPEVAKKTKAATTPYSASELNEYAWGNAFQAHSRIAESVIEREERILQQLAMLAVGPPAPPKRRPLLLRCCARRAETHPHDEQGQLHDPVELAQSLPESPPPPPPSPPKLEEPAEDAASPGEELGSTFAPGGRAQVSDPSYFATPKRVAKKEIFQADRARLAEDQLQAVNRRSGLDTPMQRERDRAAEQAKAKEQALIEAGKEDATPPQSPAKRGSGQTPLMRRKQIEATAQRTGYAGTDGYEGRVAYLVAAREGWTEAQPYPTQQSPMRVLQIAPPPPRPADFPLREDLMKLKLLELCQKAEQLGVTDKSLDLAVQDPKNPKAAVITLLLEALKTQSSATSTGVGVSS
jgi:hypothetical protein